MALGRGHFGLMGERLRKGREYPDALQQCIEKRPKVRNWLGQSGFDARVKRAGAASQKTPESEADYDHLTLGKRQKTLKS